MHRKHLIKALGLSVLAIVGVMAISASAAQAEYVLLLNGNKVTELHLLLEALAGVLKTEAGFEIKCTGGHGLALAKNLTTKVDVSANGSLTGCKWVGAACTINDPEGGEGVIKVAGEGEVTMPTSTTYGLTATSANFATVYSEGPFCTLSEEEVVEGTAKIALPNALESLKTHLAELEPGTLSLGGSKVTKLEGMVHITDLDPTATFAIHLCNLTGQPSC